MKNLPFNNNRNEMKPMPNMSYQMGTGPSMQVPIYGNPYFENRMGFPNDKGNRPYPSLNQGSSMPPNYTKREYPPPNKTNEFIQKKPSTIPVNNFNKPIEQGNFYKKGGYQGHSREKNWNFNKHQTNKKSIITQQFKYVHDCQNLVVATYEDKHPFEVLSVSSSDDFNVHFYIMNLASFRKDFKEIYNEILEEANRLSLDIKTVNFILISGTLSNLEKDNKFVAGIELGPCTNLNDLNEKVLEFQFDFQGEKRKASCILSWSILKMRMNNFEEVQDNSEKSYLLRKVDEFTEKPIKNCNMIKWNDWMGILKQKHELTSFIPGLKITAFIFDLVDTVDFFPNISCYIFGIPEKWNNDNLISLIDQQGLSKPYQIIRNPLENPGIVRLNFLTSSELNNFLSKSLSIEIILKEKGYKKTLITVPCTSRENYLNLIIPYQAILICQGDYFEICRDKQFLVKQLERLFGVVADINFAFRKDECLVTFATKEAAGLCVRQNCFKVFNREIMTKKINEGFAPIGKLYYDNLELSFLGFSERQGETKPASSLSVRAEIPFFLPRKFLNESTELSERYVQMLKLQEEESINNRNQMEEELRNTIKRENYPWEKFVKEEATVKQRSKMAATTITTGDISNLLTQQNLIHPLTGGSSDRVYRDSLQINQKINMNFNIPQTTNILDNMLLNSNGIAARIDRTYYINHDSDQPLKDTPDVIQVNPGKHQSMRSASNQPPITIINTPNSSKPVILTQNIGQENPLPTTHYVKGTKKLKYFDPELEEDELDKCFKSDQRMNIKIEGAESRTKENAAEKEFSSRKEVSLKPASETNTRTVLENKNQEGVPTMESNQLSILNEAKGKRQPIDCKSALQIKIEEKEKPFIELNPSENKKMQQEALVDEIKENNIQASFNNIIEEKFRDFEKNSEALATKKESDMVEEHFLDFDKLNESIMVQSPTKKSVESLVITLDGDSSDENIIDDDFNLIKRKTISKRGSRGQRSVRVNKRVPKETKARGVRKSRAK